MNRRAAHPLRYQAARNGQTPAEDLCTEDRHRLVTELHAWGWTDIQIAGHTRMTLYTTARIRAGLGLLPHRPGQIEGVA